MKGLSGIEEGQDPLMAVGTHGGAILVRVHNYLLSWLLYEFFRRLRDNQSEIQVTANCVIHLLRLEGGYWRAVRIGIVE